MAEKKKRKAKIQRQFAYKYKDKDHYKHVVTISENLIKELGWSIGAEVEQLVQGDTLVMVPIGSEKTERKEEPSKTVPTYNPNSHEIQPDPHEVTEGKHTRKVHKNAKRRIR